MDNNDGIEKDIDFFIAYSTPLCVVHSIPMGSRL